MDSACAPIHPFWHDRFEPREICRVRAALTNQFFQFPALHRLAARSFGTMCNTGRLSHDTVPTGRRRCARSQRTWWANANTSKPPEASGFAVYARWRWRVAIHPSREKSQPGLLSSTWSYAWRAPSLQLGPTRCEMNLYRHYCIDRLVRNFIAAPSANHVYHRLQAMSWTGPLGSKKKLENKSTKIDQNARSKHRGTAAVQHRTCHSGPRRLSQAQPWPCTRCYSAWSAMPWFVGCRIESAIEVITTTIYAWHIL